MTSKLGGRSVRTLITSLEVISDDQKHVLMLDRGENGDVTVKVRFAYENYWSASGPVFSVDDKDARVLGSLLRSEDQHHYTRFLDEIETSKIQREKPREVIEAELATKPAECTELDIERAKAANIAEERRNIELSMERDHALDKHVGFRIDGCPACERQISPGHGDGTFPTGVTYPGTDVEMRSTTDPNADDDETDPFPV
jgi:hypothetical protein